MLVLAGVSLNAIVGDNGILNQAKKAKIASDKASIIELLDTELASYNIDTITGSPAEAEEMFKNLISKGVVDTVLCSDNKYYGKNLVESGATVRGIPNFDDDGKYTGFIDYSVEKGEYKIILSVDDQGLYKAEFGEVNISAGGSVPSRNNVSN